MLLLLTAGEFPIELSNFELISFVPTKLLFKGLSIVDSAFKPTFFKFKEKFSSSSTF